MFTLGFWIGAILSFIFFAAKKPEEDLEYEGTMAKKDFLAPEALLGDISLEKTEKHSWLQSMSVDMNLHQRKSRVLFPEKISSAN